ncbi:hypothetical protein GCM10009716_20390 [Streptomyces sodiiphilus]|uniref:Ig-like domain-containing protein n=1 Tax=Streptomyces sodiiphilus TaxID=226217 RepID=A0ABN2P2A1_9ACTN
MAADRDPVLHDPLSPPGPEPSGEPAGPAARDPRVSETIWPSRVDRSPAAEAASSEAEGDAPGDGPEPGPDGSPGSATVLDDSRAEPVDGGPDRTVAAPAGGDSPDALPETLLRFGPGVPATVGGPAPAAPGAAGTAGGTGATLVDLRPPEPPPARTRGHRFSSPRRYLPAAVVLFAVAAFLLWQQRGPELSVTGVSVHTDAPAGTADCDSTTEVTAVVTTNGEPGSLRYRWLRNDGTDSGPMHQKLERGQREAELTLLWTFRGRGSYGAEATLEITSPGRHLAPARFTYACR